MFSKITPGKVEGGGISFEWEGRYGLKCSMANRVFLISVEHARTDSDEPLTYLYEVVSEDGLPEPTSSEIAEIKKYLSEALSMLGSPLHKDLIGN